MGEGLAYWKLGQGVVGKIEVDAQDVRRRIRIALPLEAEEIQPLAPTAKVVKAFNTIFAPLLSAETRKTKTLQVFVAGDDVGAKEEVSQLAKAIGFEPVDAGPLSNSRFIEPIGEMNIQFGFFLGKGTVVAPAWVQV